MTTGPSISGGESVDEASQASVGQLVSAVREDLTGLIKDEIDLAKAEIREDVKSAGMGGALVAAAGFLVVLAVVLLSVALAYGVSALGLGPGWAFLIVAAFYLIVAGLLGLWAKSRFSSITGPARAKVAARQAVQALRATSAS
ncbi:phage holin family protein [Phytoactinopolyspora halotolerans]|uniref:Phage holin family protein n=1 Tax=Phytoactinopolyspora halotolerans TaxID=1981512 RepID=A0A6L9S2D2_9ACTN|nr:phage holin family protein [Phytoactinopolyspora halotolerans]NED99208.1 phage holin family protein [Phytoactinopolyspora halotolerans]